MTAELIRCFLEAGDDPDVAADRAVAAATPGQLRSMARQWARAEAWHQRREMAREVERAEAERLDQEWRRGNGITDDDERQGRLEARRARKAAAAEAGFATVAAWEAHLEWEWDAKQAAKLGYGSVEEYRDDPDKFGRRMELALKEYLDEVGATAAMEFTEAFLATEFALGDGRRVTWGEATTADHQARVNLMMGMIEGCAEDVALHRQVLNVLMKNDARCLNDLRGAAVAS